MKINKMVVVSLLLTAILTLSGCTKVQNQGEEPKKVETKSAEVVNPSGEYTINELFAMNRPIKCTWKETSEKSDVTNIIFLSGKKMYQDVTMGDVGHSYMISNGDWLYIWNGFTNMASKMKISELEKEAGPNQGKANSSAGLDQKRDYVCEKWTEDTSVFEPPKDKDFKDTTTEMGQAVEELKNGGLDKAKNQMCDLCQKAPDEETKSKCLENAGCE
jgi:hypothetical protein